MNPLPDTQGRGRVEIQHLAAFPRLNPNPVLELSAAAEVIYANEAAGEMARALGLEHPSRMLPPGAAAMVRECLATGKPKLRVETRSGQRVISWSFFPVKPQGTVHVYAGDITDRIRAEKELSFKTSLLEAQSQTTLDGLLVVDTHGKVILTNDRFQQLWSIPAELWACQDDEKLLACVLDQLKSPESFLEEVRRLYAHPQEKSRDEIHLKDGRVLDRYSAPLVLRTGETAGRIWYFRDITLQKRAHESLCQSQERLGLALEAAAMGVWEWNVQTGAVVWSRECYRTLGLGGLGGTFRSFTNLVHPEDLPRLTQALDQAMANRSAFESRFRVRRPDGQVEWLSSVGRAYYDRGGKPLRLIGTIQNITGRKQAEESMSLLNSAVEQSSESIMIAQAAADPLDATIVFVNPAFGRMRGYAAEEVLGKTPRMFVRPTTDADFLGRLRQTLARGEVFRGQLAGYRKDGSKMELEWMVGPIHDDSGSITHWVAGQRDISEGKRAQEALRESEERYRRLVEDSPDTVFIGCEGKIAYINSAGLRLLGARTPDQVVGRPVLDFIHPDYREIVAGRIARGGLAPPVEEKFLHLDGSAVDVEVTAIPLKVNGRPGAQVIAHDLTARRRAEAQLTYERDLLRTLLCHSPDFIYFKDLASRFLKCSRATSARFGLASPEEAVGKTDFDFFDEAHARPAFEDEQTMIRSGRPLIGKVEQETFPDGRTAWALTTKVPLRNSANEIIGTFGISRDITAMKEAEARLAEMQRELLETSRQAGMAEVATSILHNVGNVLNSVNITSSLLIEKVRNSKAPNLAKAAALLDSHQEDLAGFLGSDPKGRRLPGYLSGLAARLAREHAEILKDLSSLQDHIDHIKQVVAMQQDYARVVGVQEEVAPEQLVEDALQLNAAALDRHQVQVVREYAPCPRVETEKHKVLQILVNLIRNAKYALDEGGGPEKRLVVRTQATEDRLRVAIQDNGVGIPAENLVRIFQFGFTTRKQGHGFGLHNGALAARQLGGALTAQSAGPGQGALFVLELPLPARKGPG